MPVKPDNRRILRHGMMTASVAALAALACGAHARDLVVALKTEPTSMDPQYHALTPNKKLSQACAGSRR